MSPTDSRAGTDVPVKATLFCPDCGHESRVDGDWLVRPRPGTVPRREAFVCPDCGTVIQVRPRYSPGNGEPAETGTPVR